MATGSGTVANRYAARVEALRALATGRTLELERTPLLPQGPFDTVISIGWLTRANDLEAAVKSLRALTADDGQLLFAEAAPSPKGRLSPDHDERDVAGQLRRHGFLITAIERLPMIHSRPTDNWAMVGRARPAQWSPPDGKGTR
jgi:hypothetical protein